MVLVVVAAVAAIGAALGSLCGPGWCLFGRVAGPSCGFSGVSLRISVWGITAGLVGRPVLYSRAVVGLSRSRTGWRLLWFQGLFSAAEGSRSFAPLGLFSWLRRGGPFRLSLWPWLVPFDESLWPRDWLVLWFPGLCFESLKVLKSSGSPKVVKS